MSTMLLHVLSPESRLFSGPVSFVSAYTTIGQIGIYPGHAPLLALLSSGGELYYRDMNQNEHGIYISGGFLEIQPQNVTVLADTAIRDIDLDEQSVQQAKASLTDLHRLSHADSQRALNDFLKISVQMRMIRKKKKK